MTNAVSAATSRPSTHASEAAALAWAARVFAELPVAALLKAQPLGCDPQLGRMLVRFEAQRAFCNLMGTVQGGMLAAMLDLAMAFAVLCTLEDGYVVPSLEMKTSFVAPARAGAITGEGWILRKGRSVTFMEGRLLDPEGNLLATASATGALRLRPPPAATDRA